MSHFNKEASKWDEPAKIVLMKNLAKKTIDILNLDMKIDILDFGCGTGLFGLEFVDYAKALTGIDTSPGMLEVFNKKTAEFDRIKSINIDLEKFEHHENYHLIISSMAFHHLEQPVAVLRKLKGLLNKNGRIAIVDLEKEDGTFHPDNVKMGVKHFGFAKETVDEWSRKSALGLKYQLIDKIAKNGKEYPLFLAIFES